MAGLFFRANIAIQVFGSSHILQPFKHNDTAADDEFARFSGLRYFLLNQRFAARFPLGKKILNRRAVAIDVLVILKGRMLYLTDDSSLQVDPAAAPLICKLAWFK